MKPDPIFTKNEAAAFWITCGVCEVMLAQLFLKKSVANLEPEDKKRIQMEQLIKVMMVTGTVYGCVGYFGYIKGHTAAHYVGIAATATTCSFAAIGLGKKDNEWPLWRCITKEQPWAGIFGMVKSVGMAMVLYHCPLVSMK